MRPVAVAACSLAPPVRVGVMRGAIFAAALVPALCLAHPDAAAQREIEGLLRAVGSSGCQFLRGGTAHPAAEAQQHLHKKYAYMAERNMLVSAEDFIEKAATRSSMSGEPYALQCGQATAVRSDVWLRARLQLIRQPPPR